MAQRFGRSGLAAKLMSTIAVGAIGIAVLPASPAQALGNNRTVTRSCGKNYVSSGGSGTYGWAQTRYESGNCSGQLSAGLEANNGYRFPRAYGTTSSAYTDETYWAGFRYGLHWGCNACNLTTS